MTGNQLMSTYPKLYLGVILLLLILGIPLGKGGYCFASGADPKAKVLPRLAILPLENLSGQFGASEAVMAGLVSALQKEFSLISAEEVEKTLVELKVRHTGFLTSGQIIDLGQRLKVEVVLMGIVDTYRQAPAPQVSFFCALASTKKSAPIIWSNYFCAAGQEQLYLLQRNRDIKWSSLIHRVAEDFVRSLPKNREREKD